MKYSIFLKYCVITDCITRYLMTFQNHWLISTQITQIKRQLNARIICSFHHHYLHLQFESTGCNMHQSLDIDTAQCRSDFVQHKHNPETNTKICLYMYTANLSENLKKSDQQIKRVANRFDLPNQSLRRIFQVVALCLTSSRCKSEGKF